MRKANERMNEWNDIDDYLVLPYCLNRFHRWQEQLSEKDTQYAERIVSSFSLHS